MREGRREGGRREREGGEREGGKEGGGWREGGGKEGGRQKSCIKLHINSYIGQLSHRFICTLESSVHNVDAIG